MTDSEINIAIIAVMRESCVCNGVGNEKACNWNCPCGNPVMSGACENCSKPYCTDLNAIAEAVETLSISDRTQWPMHLRQIVVRDASGKGLENPDTDYLDDTHFYNATARQRAEAFLKCLGKCKD